MKNFKRRSLFDLAIFGLVIAFAFHSVTPLQAKGAPDGFADLAQQLMPSVVTISSTQVVESNDVGGAPKNIPQFPQGSPFEDFFKDYFDKRNQEKGGKPKPRKATSLGSGFIIEQRPNGDAFVVTNNHVIEDADEVSVVLHDGTQIEASIVGRDTKTDLAVLKIQSKEKLSVASFGDSVKARVGDWVVAIGNPFGLGGTVTAGIISARGRDINAGPYDDFIQTDASINRGNSGGPMFNMKGKVIGINTAIFSPSGGSVGIGFAIPSSAAEPVVKQLMKSGQVQRGWLGVHIQVVTEPIADALGLDKAEGALVSSVVEDSPAQAAGIEPRDVILEFDGKRVTDMRKLPRIVAATEVNRKVVVKVWRNGKMKSLNVSIAKLDDEVAQATPQGAKPTKAAPVELTSLGLALSALTDELKESFNIADETEGLIIAGVDSNGTAYEEGVRPGDVLVELNQKKVTTPQAAKKLVEAMKEDGKTSVLLLIESRAGIRFVAIRLE